MSNVLTKIISIKEVDKKKRQTVGVLSTNDVDRDGDRLNQRKLQGALRTFIDASGIVVYMHQWSGGIGKVLDMSGDDTKTMVKCEYGEGYKVPTIWGQIEVDDIWKQIEQRILRSHSHAFDADRRKSAEGDFFDVDVLDTREVSVVTVPALRQSRFDVVKALFKELSPEETDGNGITQDAAILDALAEIRGAFRRRDEAGLVEAQTKIDELRALVRGSR